MANLQITPMSRMYDSIQRYYLNHPELIESLLIRIGAQGIKHDFGHEIRCCCPLHGGTNPDNFAFYYDRGFPGWKCFSDNCGKGNLATLLMKKYNTTFDRAVVALGRYAGISVDGASINVSRQTLEEESLAAFKRRIGMTASTDDKPNIFPEAMVQRSINALYHPKCAHIIHYLTGSKAEKSAWGEKCRAHTMATLQHWQVGFVPGGNWVWHDPTNPDPNHKTGWFEHRISLPWRTMEGQCMGFAGRRIDGREHRKYKTLPGTKRALALYGLSDPQCQEMIKSTGVIHLVEGYTDVWRAHQFGYRNTVAVGGTSLTDQQLRLLALFPLRYAIIYMDGDDAGIASVQGIGKQLMTKMQVLVAIPPDKKDPDDLVEYEQFCNPIVQAKPFIPKE